MTCYQWQTQEIISAVVLPHQHTKETRVEESYLTDKDERVAVTDKGDRVKQSYLTDRVDRVEESYVTTKETEGGVLCH